MFASMALTITSKCTDQYKHKTSRLGNKATIKKSPEQADYQLHWL